MQALTHGLELLQAGQLTQADAVCRQILRDDTGNADAWHLLGTVCLTRNDYTEATRCFQEAVRLHPRWSAAPVCRCIRD